MNYKTLAIFILPITILLSLTSYLTPTAASVIGDCDGNGSITPADITRIKMHITDNDGTYPPNCDANQDNTLTIADMSCASLLNNGATSCLLTNFDSPMGTNLEKVAYYSSEYPFLNVFKVSSNWVTVDENFVLVDAKDDLDLDTDGYVLSLPDCEDTTITPTHCYAQTFLFTDLDDHYPGGRYIFRHDGTGRFGFGGDVTVDWSVSDTNLGYYELDVDPTSSANGLTITLLETSASDPVRNIEFVEDQYLSAYENGKIFHPHFLDSLTQFKVLRYMDWMRTNWQLGAPIRSATTGLVGEEIAQAMKETDGLRVAPLPPSLTWADRPKTSNVRYSTTAGVPAEVMVALANESKTDMWLNIPHLATDDYVEGLATLVKAQLRPTQKLYLEYSNETWNNFFSQFDWIEAEAVAAYGTTAPAAKFNWYGERLHTICGIWDTVWSGNKWRINCVAGTQANDSGAEWILQQIMDCPLSSNVTCGTYIDSVAIAPYFGARLGRDTYEDPVDGTIHQVQSAVETWNQGALFRQIRRGGELSFFPESELDLAITGIQRWKTVAQDADIQMISYEGGQHLVGDGAVRNNPTITNLFINANKSPAMTAIYKTYFDAWRNNDGGLFMHFNNTGQYSENGSWGLQEFYDSTTHPKLDAVNDWIDANDCWWDGCVAMPPQLSVPSAPNTTGDKTLRVSLLRNGHYVSAVAFTLAYDKDQITFDDTDSNNDGIPDDILLNTSMAFDVDVTHSPGKIAISIADQQGNLSNLPESTIIRVKLTVDDFVGEGVWFDDIAVGDPAGLPTMCANGTGQELSCITSGTSYGGGQRLYLPVTEK